MKVVRVEIEDYGSFRGKHEFVLLDRGLTLVLGDNQDEPRMNSNGAGKSTIFDAIDWCWFGVVPRGDHVDSVIHDDAAVCRVTTYLIDDADDTEAVVSRYRKKGGTELSFHVGSEDRTALDTKQTQRLVEQYLGLDREVCHATVIYGQGDQFHFADAGDADRMDILTKVLQLGDIDLLLNCTKERVKQAESVEAQCSRQRVQFEAGLESDRRYLPEIESSLRDWENQRADRLQAAIRQLDQHGQHVANAQAIVAHEATVRQNIEAIRLTFSEIDLSGIEKEVAAARYSAADWGSEKQLQDRSHKELTRKIMEVQNLGGQCPTCGQALTPDHIQMEVARLSALAQEALVKAREAQSAYEGWERVAAQKEAEKQERWQAHIAYDQQQRGALREAQAQLDEIEKVKAWLGSVRGYAESLQSEMAAAREARNPWSDKLENNKLGMAAKEADLERCTSEQRDAQYRADCYRFWVEGFGPKGLRSYILDTRLQELTDAVNEWVLLLTGGTIWVRFETQTKGRSKKTLQNKLNIRVFRYSPAGKIIERNYRAWSGGEKRRVSWAIDFGLSRLIARRARKNYDLMVLDEAFSHVDSAGGEALVEMLERLREERSSIFVIEHDAAFQQHFDNRITIRKQHAASCIVEEEIQHVPQGVKKKSKREKKDNRVSAQAATGAPG